MLSRTQSLLDNSHLISKFISGEKTGTPYDDPKVCKAFLLDCCPHDILSATVNTRFEEIAFVITRMVFRGWTWESAPECMIWP